MGPNDGLKVYPPVRPLYSDGEGSNRDDRSVSTFAVLFMS